jgi:putative Mg2+ transporter-C (MgtC) family protein
MIEELTVMLVRILASLIAGAAIGFERGFHGRPAGFRTHALVCLASALLMLVTVLQDSWMTQVAAETIRTDPTRMAQGIMTGIGFLGAGVIFKEGATVRGLTTAATIWITSAIGILIGIGFYFAAGACVLATLFVLSGLRWLESRLPRTFHAQLVVRFDRKAALSELRDLVLEEGFSAQNLSHLTLPPTSIQRDGDSVYCFGRSGRIERRGLA